MKKLLFSAFTFLALICSNMAFSQGINTYMKVTAPGYDFDGGITTIGSVKQIELLSFSDGITGCGTGGVISSKCKPSFSDFSFMIYLSLAVTDFKSAFIQGKILTSVDVTMVKSGGTPLTFYKLHMENVAVTSIQEGGAQGGGIPTLSLSMSYGKIAWQVTTQDATGNAGPASSFGWDVAAQKVFNYAF